MVKIAPSILSADFANLGKAIRDVTDAGSDYIHIDVMDGVFVPNITIGPKVVSDLRSHSDIIFDVHLMIANPANYVEDFAKSGADIITVHLEADLHLNRTINKIKQLGKKAGVSIVPSTSPESLRYIIDSVDLILVMLVNPGFGGQQLIENQINKIAEIKAMVGNRAIEISADGGVNINNCQAIKNAGANVLVAGKSVFSHTDYAQVIAELRT